MIYTGDCLEHMAAMPESSVDSIVTDPPAGISFMSKGWDHHKGGRDQWVGWMTEVMRECYRVLKPGHWMLCWAIPRRQHWTMWAIEEAGFFISDVVLHCFASGFPKGRTQLKPAYEPWVMARKPGPLRELAIDACRIGMEPAEFEAKQEWHDRYGGIDYGRAMIGKVADAASQQAAPHPSGRWPANVILTDPIFDGDVEGVVGGGGDAQSRPGNAGERPSWFVLRQHRRVSEPRRLRRHRHLLAVLHYSEECAGGAGACVRWAADRSASA